MNPLAPVVDRQVQVIRELRHRLAQLEARPPTLVEVALSEASFTQEQARRILADLGPDPQWRQHRQELDDAFR